jgi:hypothetical protein
MPGIVLHVPGLPLIDGGHGHAGRTGLHSVGLLGDLVPDGPLVGSEFPRLAQGVLDLLGLLGPDAVGQDPLPTGKPGAVIRPAPLLACLLHKNWTDAMFEIFLFGLKPQKYPEGGDSLFYPFVFVIILSKSASRLLICKGRTMKQLQGTKP